MRKLLVGLTTAALAAWMVLGLVGSSSAAPTQGAQGPHLVRGHDDDRASSRVRITADKSGELHLSTTRVEAGSVRFTITSKNPEGSGVTLFQLKKGVTFKRFAADLKEEFSEHPATAARGTRHLTRDVRFYGLAFVDPGTPAAVTVRLRTGTYFLADLESGSLPTAKTVTRLRVVAEDDDDDVQSFRSRDDDDDRATVLLTSRDRFSVRGHLPARGSVRVKNVSDTIHFMEIVPVDDGTTDAEVQAYFDSGSQEEPDFAREGPGVGAGVLSPGRQLVLNYHLPRGTYVLLCFVADDEDGTPHAVMGMHKVVRLR